MYQYFIPFYGWLNFQQMNILVQFSSVAQSCSTLCDPMNRSTPGLPVHHQLLEMSVRKWGEEEKLKKQDKWGCLKVAGKFLSSVQFSSVAQLCPTLQPHESQHARPPCPSPTPRVHSDSRPSSPSSHLILCRPLFLLSPTPPSIRVFSSESTLLMRWPKHWSFSIIPSKEIPGLISFRMGWLALLAVQGLSGVFSNTTVQKHQLFSAQLSSPSNSHICKPWLDGSLLAK